MKTNILYVFGGEKAQGAEVVITRLMDYNTEHVSPHLFISPGDFAQKLQQANKPYPINCIPSLKKLNRSNTSLFKFALTALKNYLSVSYKAYQYIKRNKIQVVHSNTTIPSSYLIPLILYSKLFFKPTLFVWSDHDLSYFSKFDFGLAKLCVKLFNRTLVVSKAVQQKYPANEKIKVLYNGLDPRAFKADAIKRNAFRSRLNLSDDQMVIGMPAVITPRKGQLELIRVFEEMCKQFTNIRLVFAGGYEDATPEYTVLVNAAVAGNDKVIHMGYADDMIAFYNGCDIIVNNSNRAGNEPLGTTMYEAMACEKIVVAADTGGTREIISDNVDGFLFKAENPNDLQQKLTYVLNHYAELKPIRTAAIDKVNNKFSIFSMAKTYNSILESIKSN